MMFHRSYLDTNRISLWLAQARKIGGTNNRSNQFVVWEYDTTFRSKITSALFCLHLGVHPAFI